VRNGYLGFKELSDTLNSQAKEVFYKDRHPPEEEIVMNERIDHLIFEQIVWMMSGAESADKK